MSKLVLFLGFLGMAFWLAAGIISDLGFGQTSFACFWCGALALFAAAVELALETTNG